MSIAPLRRPRRPPPPPEPPGRDDLQLGRRRLPRLRPLDDGDALACLAAVAAHHRPAVTLNELRQRFPELQGEASLGDLIAAAARLGLTARTLEARPDELRHVRTPAILRWRGGYVVLLAAHGAILQIYDPAAGDIRVEAAEVAAAFDGRILEVLPIADVREAPQPRLRLTALLSRSPVLLRAGAHAVILSALLQGLLLLTPLQIQVVVDQAIGRGDADLLQIVALGAAGVVVAIGLVEACRSWSLQLFGALFTYETNGKILRHLLRLPTRFFEGRDVGETLARLGALSAVQDAVTRGMATALLDGVMALTAGAVLLAYAPALAAAVFAATLLSGGIALGTFPALRTALREQLETSTIERGRLIENIRSATVIKLMGRGDEREAAWRALYAESARGGYRAAQILANATLAQKFLGNAAMVFVIYAGAAEVLAGRGLSAGMFLAFLAYRQMFGDRTLSLITQATQLRLLSVHLQRLAEIVGAEPEAVDDLRPADATAGEIRLRGVDFGYDPTQRPLLRALDLTISPGEFVAIVGASGAGKSTLLKLLLGLHPPMSGTILLGGEPATPALWRAWRARMGVVAQDDELLSGTVASNIAFFDPEPDTARIEAAARQACVHDDILRMPMRYLSLIGEMGSTLSGGQKQRVLLARALYRNPQVLVLDEGTANLDPATEGDIADMVESLKITRIVVAHRPALVERAHRVLALEDGGLVELRSEATPSPIHHRTAGEP